MAAAAVEGDLGSNWRVEFEVAAAVYGGWKECIDFLLCYFVEVVGMEGGL